MKNRIIQKLMVTGIFLLTILPGFSQLTNTLYFMKGVPQVYQINPAFQPGCKYFSGLPGLSPLQLRVQNEPFALKDLLHQGTDGIWYTFMHTPETALDFLNVLNKKNFLNADVGVPFFSMGFGSPDKGWFFAFDVTQRITTNFTYPKALFEFPIYGPQEGMVFDFNGFGINTMMYTEVAVNYSHKINDMITVGLRGKALLGQVDLSSTKFDVTLATSEKEWIARSNIEMNATLPFLDVRFDEAGMISPDSTNFISDIEKSIPRMIFNPKNTGLAMDLGVDIRPFDKLQLSASIIDFGAIKWKDKVYNLSNKGEYKYDGINVTLEGIDQFQPILDSLKESFKFRADSVPYSTWLPTKIYLGAAYYVHPKISFGVLSRTEFYQSTIRQQFTMSANLYPIRMISTTFSYSIMEGSYKNLGFGLALKLLPLNFYIITDTAPSIYFWPMDAKYLNLRVGLNFMIGGKQKKKAQKFDLPLVN